MSVGTWLNNSVTQVWNDIYQIVRIEAVILSTVDSALITNCTDFSPVILHQFMSINLVQ